MLKINPRAQFDKIKALVLKHSSLTLMLSWFEFNGDYVSLWHLPHANRTPIIEERELN